jgi:anti-sigma B factor antagonist
MRVQTYLSVFVRDQGQSTVIELDGELDLGSSSQLEQALEHAGRDRPALVVVDLTRLSFTDMAGLRVLMAAQEQYEREGGRLVLANVPDSVLRLMRLAQVNGFFTIVENGS